MAHDLPQLSQYAATLGRSPEALAAYLKAREGLRMRLTRLMSYASMSASVDGKDPQAAACRDRAASLGSVFAAASAFENPELLALDEQAWRVPGCPASRSSRLRGDDRARLAWPSPRPQRRGRGVAGLWSKCPLPASAAFIRHWSIWTWISVRRAALQIGQGNIDRLVADPDRQIRREAWEAYADAHLSTQHTHGSGP